MQARLQQLRWERFEREEKERNLSPPSLRLQTVNGLCGFSRLCVLCSPVALWYVKLNIEDILGVTTTVQEPHGFDSMPRSWLSLEQDCSGSQPVHSTSVSFSGQRRGDVASTLGDAVEDPDAVLFVACKECGIPINSKLDECPACGRSGPGSQTLDSA